jgi:hypothetical protein
MTTPDAATGTCGRCGHPWTDHARPDEIAGCGYVTHGIRSATLCNCLERWSPDAATVEQLSDTYAPIAGAEGWDGIEHFPLDKAAWLAVAEKALTLHAQTVAQAVREEREACARIAEYSNGEDYEAIANAIRARGPQVGQLDNTWLCQAPFPCPCPMCQGPQAGPA